MRLLLDFALRAKISLSIALLLILLPEPHTIQRLTIPAVGAMTIEPGIVYMDGDHTWDSCLSGLKRSVSGESGVLISHTLYGTHTYNGSKNCFLTLNVPLGYRLRLRALEFLVHKDNDDGNGGGLDKTAGDERCEHDTLHVFDHEHRALDPSRMEELSVEERAPGRIIGQFCGEFPPTRPTAAAASSFLKSSSQSKASSIMAESTHNTLTLWWHTGVNVSRSNQAEGFRLLWSAFRTKMNVKDMCRHGAEFACKEGMECIPLSLGCNSHPDCRDTSDLDPQRQIAHGCENVPSDFLSQLTGLKKLLLCTAAALLFGSTCLCCCACCYILRRPEQSKPGRWRSRSRDSTLIAREVATSAVCEQPLLHQHHSNNKVALEEFPSPATMTAVIGQQPLPPSFSPPQIPPPTPMTVGTALLTNPSEHGSTAANQYHRVEQTSSKVVGNSSTDAMRAPSTTRAQPGRQAPLAELSGGSLGSTSTSTSIPPARQILGTTLGGGSSNLPRTTHLPSTTTPASKGAEGHLYAPSEHAAKHLFMM